MSKKLYGVDVNYLTNEVEIQSTEVLKETPKTYKVKSFIDWYGYKQVIHKSDPSIAFSKEVAVKLFIKRQEIKLDRARDEVTRILEKIEEAKGIIYRDSGSHE